MSHGDSFPGTAEGLINTEEMYNLGRGPWRESHAFPCLLSYSNHCLYPFFEPAGDNPVVIQAEIGFLNRKYEGYRNVLFQSLLHVPEGRTCQQGVILRAYTMPALFALPALCMLLG